MCMITVLKDGVKAGGGIGDVIRKPSTNVSKATPTALWSERASTLALYKCIIIIRKQISHFLTLYYFSLSLSLSLSLPPSLPPSLSLSRIHCIISVCSMIYPSSFSSSSSSFRILYLVSLSTHLLLSDRRKKESKIC